MKNIKNFLLIIILTIGFIISIAYAQDSSSVIFNEGAVIGTNFIATSSAETNIFFGSLELISTNIINGTKKIQLSSYERAINPTHYAELIRLDWKTDDAKAAIAFRDENGKSKAWLAAHKYLGPGKTKLHNHFSIETSDTTGALQTRLSFPYDATTTEVGFFSSNININDGKLRINGDRTSFKELQFGNNLSNNLNPDFKNIRWSVRQDNTTESGFNNGSNFRIVRFNDIGVAQDSPLFIKRNTGNIGIGTITPQSTLHIPDGKYIQIEDNNIGVPPVNDCDSDLKRGRISIDTLNNRLYICNGAARGWDYINLID